MLRTLLALLVVSAAGALHAAAARDSPFCLGGCDFGASDCSYDSYLQCQAAASGRETWCDANPFFRQNRGSQPGRYSLVRRRF